MNTPDVSLRAWLAGQALAGFNIAETNLPDHVIARQVVSLASAVASELVKADQLAAEAQQIALGFPVSEGAAR